MIRLLNILFFGLAVLFFAVLALAMYKSVRYVNENQPYSISQKIKPKSNTINKDSFSLSGNDTTATEDDLPEIDFAAIDSLLDDDEELDSLIQLTDDVEPPTTDDKQKIENDGQEVRDTNYIASKEKEQQKNAETKILNEKPKNETKKIAEAKPPAQSKATPTNYSQTGRYYIAVGAFTDKTNAQLVQNQLKKLGYKNIKRIKNNKFTSIRLEGYPKKSSAQMDLTKVRKYYKEAYIRRR